MTALRDDRRIELTVEEFLDWPGDGSGAKFQLIDGSPRAMAPASADHGVIQLNIGSIIRDHLRKLGSKCRIATEAPVIPAFKSRKNARAPDVAVACSPPSKSRVFDDPILIVEVLSPGNEDETWESIRALAGVRSLLEILVVNSTRVEAELWRRTPGEDWAQEPIAVAGPGSSLRLETVDVELPMAEVYRMTLLEDEARRA